MGDPNAFAADDKQHCVATPDGRLLAAKTERGRWRESHEAQVGHGHFSRDAALLVRARPLVASSQAASGLSICASSARSQAMSAPGRRSPRAHAL